jgi:predicted small lipoprotein YifL
MKTIAASALLALAACGGDGDDALGEKAKDAAETKAENLSDMADNAATPAQADALNDRADAVEQAGEKREEQIDDSDVDADELSGAQKNALVNGQ